jgi:hypothetical protein
VGASSHLSGELFQRATGTRLTHIPYRGGGPAMQDLAAGKQERRSARLKPWALLLAQVVQRLPTLGRVAAEAAVLWS